MYNEKEKNVTANITKAKVVSVNFRMMQNIHVNVRKTTQIVFLMLLLHILLDKMSSCYGNTRISVTEI